MKKLLIFSGLFLFLFIVIDRGSGLVMDHLFMEVTTGHDGGKVNQYFALSHNPDLVIMGSSRAAHQVIPDSFRISAFNLGHGGMRMPFQTALLRMMEQRKKLPRMILLQLDPSEFMGDLKTGDVQNLRYYYDESDTLREYIDELAFFEKYKYWINTYRYNGRVINIAHNYLKSIRLKEAWNGYEPETPTTQDSMNTLYSSRMEPEVPDFEINLRKSRYFDSFVAICKRNNIQLICFTAPIFKSPAYFHEGARQMALRLKRDNIRYINFEASPLPELQDHPRFWKDNRHLNHIGAQILSAGLRRFLASPDEAVSP